MDTYSSSAPERLRAKKEKGDKTRNLELQPQLLTTRTADKLSKPTGRPQGPWEYYH